MGKAHFKQWLWDTVYDKVKNYHGKNGISLLRNIARSALIKGNLSPFLVLEHNIKRPGPGMPFNQ